MKLYVYTAFKAYSKLCKLDAQLELESNFLRSCIREYLRIGVPGCFVCNVLGARCRILLIGSNVTVASWPTAGCAIT